MGKITHFEVCMDDNCERKWCVDRRNAKCLKTDDCEVRSKRTNRCIHCHMKYYCSGYGVCDLHGDHGP